jgi:hypothetical protein
MAVPAWIYLGFGGILLLPYVLQKASTAILTDRNIYVFKTGFGFTAKRVLLKAPLGSVETRFGGGAFPGRYLVIGDQKIWLAVNRKIHERAQAMAAAASGGPSALEAGAGTAGADAAGPATADAAPTESADAPAEPDTPNA